MKVKSESEVVQSCQTLSNPIPSMGLGLKIRNTNMVFLELICLLAGIIFCSQLIIFGTIILFPLFLMLAVNGTTSDIQGRN